MRGFHRLTLARVVQETPEAISIALQIPEELSQTFVFQAGQHLTFRAQIAGEELRRTYSICSGPEETHLRVAIKRVVSGQFSNFANDTFVSGQTVEVMPPTGRFVVPSKTSPGRELLAFSAGAGITPIVSMISHVLAQDPESHFTLVYGNRSVKSILFLDVLHDLKDRYLDRFRLFHTLSSSSQGSSSQSSAAQAGQALQGDETGSDSLHVGRIDGEKVKALAEVIDYSSVDHIFLCGPGTMSQVVRAALVDLEVPEDRIHDESFGSASISKEPVTKVVEQNRKGAGAPLDGAEIVAVLDGVRHRFGANAGESVVDAAIRAGVFLPWSCKGGMCTTCRARVIAGSAHMKANYSLEPWEIEQAFTLTCQAVAVSDQLILDFDSV